VPWIVSDRYFQEAVMKTRTLVYASAFGCMWGFTATAQQVPRLNIEATCKAEQPLVAGDPNPYERQLQGMWGSTAAGLRQRCGQEAQIGGTPSYVDMLTCLQMAQGTSSTALPRRRRPPD
jgi:hypothetical protein